MSTNSIPLLDWMKQNAKHEYDLALAIRTGIENLYNKVPYDVPIDETHVQFGVWRNNPKPPVDVGMDAAVFVFLGIMSKAMVDALSGELEGLIQSGKVDALIKQKIYEVFASMVKYATTTQPPAEVLWVSCMKCKKETPANGLFCMNCKAEIR